MEEQKINEGNRNYMNVNMNTFNNLSVNDYELLFLITQLIPLMDRCGRFMSGKHNIKVFRYFFTFISSDT